MKKVLLISSLFALSVGCSNSSGGSDSSVRPQQVADTGTEADLLGNFSQACQAGTFSGGGFMAMAGMTASTDAGAGADGSGTTEGGADAGTGATSGLVLIAQVDGSQDVGQDQDQAKEQAKQQQEQQQKEQQQAKQQQEQQKQQQEQAKQQQEQQKQQQEQAKQQQEQQKQQQEQAKQQQEQQQKDSQQGQNGGGQTDGEGQGVENPVGTAVATQNFLEVDEDQMTLITRAYTTANCSGEAIAESRVVMDYDIEEYTAGQNNQVDLRVRSARMEMMTEAAADAASEADLCGFSNWESDESRSILGTDCLANDRSIDQILSYGNGRLTFGDMGGEMGEDGRPTTLGSVAFTKMAEEAGAGADVAVNGTVSEDNSSQDQSKEEQEQQQAKQQQEQQKQQQEQQKQQQEQAKQQQEQQQAKQQQEQQKQQEKAQQDQNQDKDQDSGEQANEEQDSGEQA